MMFDVLLVKINYEEVLPEDREFDLSTAYLAAALRQAGFLVKIIDASLEGLSYEATLARILENPARIIGLSVWLHRLVGYAENLIADLRRAGSAAHITMGNHSATFLYEELLRNNPGLDSVVCGEGELTVVEMAERITSGEGLVGVLGVAFRDTGSIVYNVRPAQCALDELPPPALDYLPKVKEMGQFMSMLTSRGCYGKCTFCSTSPFYRAGGGKAWRGHSPGRVLAEIRNLHAEGVRYIGFRDDNFVGPGKVGRQRAQQIAELLIAENMGISYYIACRVDDVERELFMLLKQSGLKRVFLGVESMSQRRLDAFNKLVTVEDNLAAMRTLSELGIPFTVGFIGFAPDTTWREFRESCASLQASLAPLPGGSFHDPFNPVEVFPGTALAEELKARGMLRGDYRRYTYRFEDRGVRYFSALLKVVRQVGKPLGKLAARVLRQQRKQELTGGDS